MMASLRGIVFGVVAGALPFYATVATAAEARGFSEAVPVEGAPFKARLDALGVEGMTVWALPGGETKKLPLADLCWWGRFRETPPRQQLVLVDGSVIVADPIGIEKEHLVADWALGGEFKLPLEWLAGIIVAPPVDRQQADLFRFRLIPENRATEGTTGNDKSGSAPDGPPGAKRAATGGGRADAPAAESDRLILLNGDELAGEIVGLNEVAIKVKTVSGEITVGKEKVAAIAFNPSLAAKPTAENLRLWVGLSDGSRLAGTALAIDHGKAKLTTLPGVQLTLPLEKVVALQPLGGKAKYLSDLKPAKHEQTPFLDLKWPFRADRNVLGTQLRAGGQLNLKGLGMHSAARLIYDLDKPYRRFAADAAIDDQTAGRGSAVFRVTTDDGSGNWQLKYESPVVRGGAPPQPISVDVTGAKRLSLFVDFADHGDEQAHADWLGARIIP